MLLALAGTGTLGAWQYAVAHRDDIARQVLQASPRDLNEIHLVGEYVRENWYAQSVIAAGELDCTQSVQVSLGKARPQWLVCPLALKTGATVALVLGRGSGISDFVGEIKVVGRLQPAQDTAQLSPLYSPKRVVGFLNTDDLVLRWQTDVYDGYVVLSQATSGGEPLRIDGVRPLRDAELVLPPAGIEVRNLMYAWQWWIFAAFAIFLWGRFIRDEFRPDSETQTNEA